MRKLNTGDAFALVRLINVTGVKETFRSELEKVMKGDKVVIDKESDKLTLVFALMSALAQAGAEDAFYEFISGPFEMTPEEIKNLPPEETLQKIKELASVSEWQNFFKRAGNLAK